MPVNSQKTERVLLSVQEQLEQSLHQNELLKQQLMNTSLVNELTRVLQTCNDLDGIVNTVLLGIQEIIGFERAILFSIEPSRFSLTPHAWVGLDEKDMQPLKIPLGFEGGDITDAVFLNRHIIVSEPDTTFDTFSKYLGSHQYLVMPLVSKAPRRCYEEKNCSITSCPAHGGHNPYCWSISGAAQLTNAVSEDERRQECVKCPCFRCEGVFWMDREKSSRGVTSDDITMLSAVINVAGLIMQNYRFYNALETANGELKTTNKRLKVLNHDLQVAQSKINSDLDRARKIQFGLLPQGLTGTDQVVIGTHYIPAAAVGGDYYDVFEIEPEVYGVIVADVSGHGISSALIMAMVKVLLKSHAHSKNGPQKTLERINSTFLTEIKSDNFVTVFYAVLNTREKTFSYTSAGHCPILMLDKTSNNCTTIKADGLFLGVFDDMMLAETTVKYSPGTTRIVLYTDGLTEDRNDDEEMFDLSRLQQIAEDSLTVPPSEAIKSILKSQRDFCGSNHEPEDDITILIIDF